MSKEQVNDSKCVKCENTKMRKCVKCGNAEMRETQFHALTFLMRRVNIVLLYHTKAIEQRRFMYVIWRT